MTQPAALRLRRAAASPRRQHPAGGTGRRAAALLLRLACAALLAWIGYIHLHLWLEGYRQIPTDGPLFLLDAVAGFALAAALLGLAAAAGRAGGRRLPRQRHRRPAHQPHRGPVRLQGIDLGGLRRPDPDHRDDHPARPDRLDRPGGGHPRAASPPPCAAARHPASPADRDL